MRVPGESADDESKAQGDAGSKCFLYPQREQSVNDVSEKHVQPRSLARWMGCRVHDCQDLERIYSSIKERNSFKACGVQCSYIWLSKVPIGTGLRHINCWGWGVSFCFVNARYITSRPKKEKCVQN
jgi:hypothetical protein